MKAHMVRDELFDWHFLLLGLAGRLGDDVLSRCRDLLATGSTVAIRTALVGAALERDVPLLEVEADFLAAGLSPGEHSGPAPDEFARVRRTDTIAPVPYAFAAEPPTDLSRASRPDPVDQDDDAAIVAVASTGGLRGLWAAWRWAPADAVARRVYVVEADADADVVRATGRIQAALSGPDPRVEVYPTGTDLPAYQRRARGHGALLWSRTSDADVRIAALYDDVDAYGPRFRPDHPRVDGDERQGLVEYLWSGEALLLTTARVDDVVDPRRGDTVPTTFRTDGAWVWSDATTYYLEEYGLLPDPHLAAHIRAHGHVPPPIDDVGRHRAMAALRAGGTGVWMFG